MADDRPDSALSSGATRRTVLKTLGIAGAVGATGVGAAMATATPPSDDAPALQWLNRYEDWASGFELTALVPTDDGYVVGAPDYTYHKVDESGETVWSRSIETDHDRPQDFVRLTDGGYAAVGYDSAFDGPDDARAERTTGFVVAADENGDVRWEYEHGFGQNEDIDVTLWRGHATPDGGVLAIGAQDDPPNNDDEENVENPLVVKLTADGEEAWRRVDLPHDDDEIRGPSLDVMADGTYLLHTYEGMYGIAPEGEVVWDRARDDRVVPDVIATSDGGTAWCVQVGNDNSYGVVETDDRGTIQWSQTYEDVPGVPLLIAERRDGFVLAGDTEGVDAIDADVVLLGVGSDGTKQWQTVAGNDENDQNLADTDLVARDGAYVLCGRSSPNEDSAPDEPAEGQESAPFVAKFSKEGDDGSGTTTTTTETTTTETTTETTDTTTDTGTTDTTTEDGC